MRKIKVSKKRMLTYLNDLFFEEMVSKEEISGIYKFLTGKRGEKDNIVSICGKYRLLAEGKKGKKIYLHNLYNDEIYYYNIRNMAFWKRNLQNCISDALLNVASEMSFIRDNS